jgi:tetratricopeptide (TPR) repeat protein
LESDELFVNYYHLIILSSLLQHNHQAAEQPFELLFSKVDSGVFQKKRFNILYNLGVWLRRGGFYSQSEGALLCALKSANDATDKMKTLNSLGGIARQYANNLQAKNYFQQTLELAEEIDNKKAIAITNNNLGVMALEFNEVAKAKSHFKSAYRNFQISQYESGELNSGLNLLFSFAILNSQQMYERAAPRVKELVDKYNSDEKNIYFTWINTFAKVQFNKLEPSIEQQKTLSKMFEKLNEAGLQRLLNQYASKALKIEVSPKSQAALEIKTLPVETRPWLKKAIECNF